MKIIVLKTNLTGKVMINQVAPIFNNDCRIKKWNVDLQDIDNVLRLEAEDQLSESAVIKMVCKMGFECQSLPDFVGTHA